jgi:hypothetical protein
MAFAWTTLGILAAALFATLGLLASQGIDGLSARIDGLSARIDGLSARIDGLSTRLDTHIARPG